MHESFIQSLIAWRQYRMCRFTRPAHFVVLKAKKCQENNTIALKNTHREVCSFIHKWDF